MPFRANVRLVSLLFATIVIPHLVGCSIPRRHYTTGLNYTQQAQKAQKASDDIDGLRESIRLLELAEKEHENAEKWQAFLVVGDAGDNRRGLATVRNELEVRRRKLATLEQREKTLEQREKALAQGKHLKFVESARSNLAKGDPSAAFHDIARAERLVGDTDELAALRKELRAAFSSDPSRIDTKKQARWFYTVRSFRHIFANGAVTGDVFEGAFWISQRFDRNRYRAMFANPNRGVEVVIESAEFLPHGGTHPFIEAMVRVKDEQQFQRAFGNTVVLPVVEILFRSR